MLRRGTLVALMALVLAAVLLSGAGASTPLRTDPSEPDTPALTGLDFGDAPEGAPAYPLSGVFGQFPTCQVVGPAAWIQQTNFGAFFGSFVDFELDGNAGTCTNVPCFPPYDLDECFRDGDAGLLFPEPFTIDNAMSVVPCPNSKGTQLGGICQAASWGANVDIYVTNLMPNQTPGFANLLVDWNMDGDWNDVVVCPTQPGITISEHALVDFLVPNGFSGPLSQLLPPNFLIGPQAGHAWTRFTITERPVGAGWTGEGGFEDGESEDYLLAISDADPGIKWSQLPNRALPGLHAHDYVNAGGGPESLTWADDWLCQGGEVTDLHWWGNYELDDAQQERRGDGIHSFHLSIHSPVAQDPCLPAEPPLWQAAVPFAVVSETNTGMVNNEGSPIYKYTYYLPEPFEQKPGQSYWFDISAISQDIKNPPMWRWQESARTSNPAFPPNQCGAAQKQSPPGTWLKQVWAPVPPDTQPRFSEMAFEVTSQLPEGTDWGDAPDKPYPTLSASTGASHLVTAMGPRLGTLVDVEMDGQPSAYADGDDQLGLADEDGVLFTTPLLPGQLACVDVTVDPTGVPGVLDGWIDFDGDGVWSPGLPEQVFTSQPLGLGLNANLCFSVPAAAPAGFTYARFRISAQGGLPPAGPAADGEVEDYRVRVEAVKWSQPPVRMDPDPAACYWGWDELSLYQGKQIVADDWRCEDARPVTDIHWWGSYLEWEEQAPPQPTPVAFHIGIWTDVPAIPEPFSHPGVMIWEWIAPYPEVHERAAGCDFHPGMMQQPDTCFEYHLNLPPGAWFHQEPGQHVYWLSISAIYPQPVDQYPWGWKTRPHFFNDDAVRILAPTAPQPGVIYEFGEPIMLNQESWDMAFALTTEVYDYGDAADPTYPTLLASDGARHAQVAAGPFMGNQVDAEGDGQPDAGARGDDLAGMADEDGVSFIQPFEPGWSSPIGLSLAGSPYGCYLSAWIDFNRDGTWDNSAGSFERIVADSWLNAYSSGGLSVAVPPWPISSIGLTTARFRCASVTGLGPTGPAPDGEVEDYQVEIMAPPQPPVVSIAIANTTDVRLSWPSVTLDIYGNTITPDGYRVRVAYEPYASGNPAGSVWAPFPPGPISWDHGGKVGNPALNHFYTVETVLRDINVHELRSVRSNEVAEFDFALTPGSP